MATVCQKLFVDSVSKMSIFTLNIIFLEIYEAEYMKALCLGGFFLWILRGMIPSVIPNETGLKSLHKGYPFLLASDHQFQVCYVA